MNLGNPDFVDGTLVYLSYGDAGMVVLDISDGSKPKRVSQTRFTHGHRFDVHTVAPDFEKKLAYVNSEAVTLNCKGPLDHATVVDISNSAKPVPLARFPTSITSWKDRRTSNTSGRTGRMCAWKTCSSTIAATSTWRDGRAQQGLHVLCSTGPREELTPTLIGLLDRRRQRIS